MAKVPIQIKESIFKMNNEGNGYYGKNCQSIRFSFEFCKNICLKIEKIPHPS